MAAAGDSMADDFEDKDDPLKDPKPLKIIEDEEDESGGGVDYRRMYKGYLSVLTVMVPYISEKT